MPFIDLQESQDRRLQMLLQTANQIQQNKIAREDASLRREQLMQGVQENKIKAAELRAKAPLYKSQAEAYSALAGQRGAQSQLLNNLNEMESGGLPSNMVMSGIGPSGPRFENLDALKAKKEASIATREYTPMEAKGISQAESLIGKIARLKDMVGTNAENTSYLPYALGSKSGQMFQSLKKDISNTLLYLRSGAQINEQEFKRLNSQLPQIFRRSEVDKDQLDRFTEEFSGTLERMKFGTGAEGKSTTPKVADLAGMGFNVPEGFTVKSFKPKASK